MNNIHQYNVNVEMSNTRTISHCENFSSSTSSAYDDISPRQHNSTDSCSERHNQSTLSSKKSEISSEEATDLTVDSLERTLTEDRLSKVEEILAMLSSLSDLEKLIIQLKFPLVDSDNYDDNNVNIGGTCDFGICANQNEHSEALTWVLSHLEEDRTTCLKKQEVYEDYKSYCLSHNVKYLSTADFGKVMKKAFPTIKARRLGARGQSKYCYSGLKNRNEIKSPTLADVGLSLGVLTELSHDKSSGRESVSSNYHQPDLSNIPEYELSQSILIDSALVIIEFIKRVSLTEEINSLKQAVAYLLLNNQVELSSPHAVRLLPFFQRLSDTQSSKKRCRPSIGPLGCHLGIVDPLIRAIKKEEGLSSPSSVPPFQSSAMSSPQNLKRPKVPFVSTITDSVPSYYDQQKMSFTASINSNPVYCHQSNNSFNYGISGNPQFYSPSMMSLPSLQDSRQEMSPSISNMICPKPFMPNTFSTPIKNSPAKIVSPILNSPLLERNPTTTKKLELTGSVKPLYPHSGVNYPLIQPRTNVADRSHKMSMYSFPLDFNYQSGVEIENQTVKPKNPYLEREVSSPISMTSRNYGSVPFVDEFACEVEKFDTAPTLKRHIGSDFPIDFNPSPRLSHFSVENDYSNIDSIPSGIRQQIWEDNQYLDTPGNSPTNRSIDNDVSEEHSSRNNTPQNSTGQLSLTDNNNKITIKPAYTNVTDFNPKNIFPLNSVTCASPGRVNAALSYNNNSEIMMSYTNEVANDEFNVSSTTNPSVLDIDGHPSTTVLHNTTYK